RLAMVVHAAAMVNHVAVSKSMISMDEEARKQRRPVCKERAAFLSDRAKSGPGLGAFGQKRKNRCFNCSTGKSAGGRREGIFGGVFFFSSRRRSSIRRISATNIAFVQKSFCIFPTTHWTTLLMPIHQRTEQSEAALNQLFEIY